MVARAARPAKPPGATPKGHALPVATERTHRRHLPGSGPVALFIDWDNFAIGLRQEMPERPPDLGPILRWARRTGTLIVCRAYGEWRDPTERLAIYNAGVEAVYAPVLPLGGSLAARSGAGGAKSLADTAMAVDVAEFLTLVPSVGTLILATSDKDLIPVIRFAQKRGVFAGVVGSDRTAGALRELADDFVTYRQLLEDEAPQPVAVSRPVTVPPLRVARPLRRFGDIAVDPIGRDPRPLMTPPAIIRTIDIPPVASHAATAAPTFAGDDDSSGDTASDGSRRRRRGGRRRRGAETFALEGGESSDASEHGSDGAVEEHVPAAAEIVPETAAPVVAAAPTSARAPIVRPMIAPRAPRPSPERFATTLGAPAPSVANAAPGVDGPAAPVPVIAPVAPVPVIASVAPVAAITSLAPVASVAPVAPFVPIPSFTATTTQRPRVQLPGERLRRLAPGAGPAHVSASPASVSEAATDASDDERLVAGETHDSQPVAVASSADQSSPVVTALAAADAAGANPDGATAMPAHLPDEVPGTDLAEGAGQPAETAESAARGRRRRGGRGSRASSDGDASADALSAAQVPVIEGPIASPNDPDSAAAPESPAADGPGRGRRRGGRTRSTTEASRPSPAPVTT